MTVLVTWPTHWWAEGLDSQILMGMVIWISRLLRRPRGGVPK